MFFRSSRPEMFCKKAVLIDFPKFARKHIFQILFITKVAGQGRQLYLKRYHISWCFLRILRNLEKHLFLRNTSFGCFQFFKIDILINFPIFTRKYLCWKARNFAKKDTPTQVSSCEYHKIFKNSCFIKHPRWLLLNMVEEFLRISNSSQIFVQKYLQKRDLQTFYN